MSGKWTPGPWRIGNDGRETLIFGEHPEHVGMIGEAYRRIYAGEGEANARLIAAAPELVEALADIEDALGKIIGGAHDGWEADPDAVLDGLRATAFAALRKAGAR